MAFPLKSGADLYNQQLIRAAVWNHGADPSETVTGLLYFNTSNSSAAKKLRLHTGTEWKTIAFEEDLDVANNADFKALEDKVKLLAGEVDTDAIISNMKEVSNFLAGFAEDAKLMDVLKNKLDKSNDAYYGLDFNSTGTDGASRMVLKNNNNVLVGFGHNGTVTYLSNYLTSADIQIGDTITVKEKASTNRYDLIHSGNYPLYALPVIGGTIGKGNSNSFPLTISSTSSYTGLTIETSEGMAYFRYQGGSKWGVTDVGWKNSYTLLHSGNVGEYNAGGAGKLVIPSTNTTAVHVNSSGNVTIGASDLAGTSVRLAVYGNHRIHRGTSSTEYLDISVDDVSVYYNGYDPEGWCSHYFQCNGTTMLTINGKTGNVLIGTTEDNGAKLQVNGNMTLGYYKIGFGGSVDSYHIGWGNSSMFSYNNYFGHYFSTHGGTERLRITQGGNVGIGLTNPSAQLHVAQDIVANGTIACKGIAAEGDAMDMVDKTVLYIIPNGTQQTFTLNHGLGTREIAISIYEITSMGTNMILTDVEIVDDNNISVSFGNPPSENHMVVVMG